MKRMTTMSVLLVVLLGMFANVGFAAELKKVMILSSRTIEAMPQYVLKGLAEAGFVEQQNLMSTVVLVSGITDPAQLVAQITAQAPDVVINVTEFGQLLVALKDLSIPVITIIGVEPYVNAAGTPLANVTGMYTMLQDMVYNSYKFFQKVAPLKPGQSVVFLEAPEMSLIPKAMLMEALQRLQIPLKAVVNTTVYEDWQQAVLQYNADPDIGWILMITGPIRKRDGSRVDAFTDFYPWEQTHLKKPVLSYWDMDVQAGKLCGFTVDLNALGCQTGKMAARVLQGEPIQSIKAEYPQKVSISLNRKTATNLGIVFSLDVLNLANVIFDDYDGKQVIRK